MLIVFKTSQMSRYLEKKGLKAKPIALLLVAVFFFSLFPFHLYAQEQNSKGKEPTNLAVLPIKCGEVVTEQDCLSLNDEFWLHFSNLEGFRIIPREEMQSVLKEKELRLDCAEQDCAVEIGLSLGLKKVIYGNVDQPGDEATISIHLVDVDFMKVEKTAVRKTAGPVTGLIFEISGLVQELGTEEPEILEEPSAGELEEKEWEEQEAVPFYKKHWLSLTIGGVLVTGVITSIAIMCAGDGGSGEGRVAYEW